MRRHHGAAIEDCSHGLNRDWRGVVARSVSAIRRHPIGCLRLGSPGRDPGGQEDSDIDPLYTLAPEARLPSAMLLLLRPTVNCAMHCCGTSPSWGRLLPNSQTTSRRRIRALLLTIESWFTRSSRELPALRPLPTVLEEALVNGHFGQ